MAGQTGARTVDAAPDGALPRGDPPPASEDVRGLCIADSVCGVFAEIKPPAPPS